MRIAVSVVVSFVLAACGSSSTPAEKPESQPVEESTLSPEEEKEQKALATLRAHQEAACPVMCERLTQCSVEDARANMTAEKFAELKVEETAPRHTEECNESCTGSELSPRQVTTIEACLRADDTACAALLTCLDAVQPAK